MKKFSKNYLYYHLIADFFSALVLGLVFIDALLIENEAEEVVGFNAKALPFFIGGILIVYGALILYRVLYLRFGSYTLSKNEIRVTRGVFFRKNSVLDYSRMHAINKKQNIIQRLCGLSVLTVDSGSANTSVSAEVVIYESTDEAQRLLSILKAKKNGASEEEVTEAPTEVILPKGEEIIFSSAKKFVYSLLNIATAAFSLLAVCLFALAVYFCLVPVLHGLLEGGIFYFLVPALLVALIALVGISAITFLASILQAFVGYYGFRILKGAADLEISYGLLTRHTNTFGYDRIQGVIIRQGIIQRIFGYATLQLEVIGYHEGGSDQNEGTLVGILLPLIAMREIEPVLSELLPAYLPLPRKHRAVRYFPFVSWTSLFITVGYALAAFFTFFAMRAFGAQAMAFSIMCVLFVLSYAVVEGVHLFGAYLAYKNAGLAISGDRITLYGGGYIRRVTTVLCKSLVAVEEVTTPMRQKQGIYTAVLHIRTNAQTNEIKVGMLSQSAIEALKAVLPDR